ncbi:MAG TPA: DNRLRE domain-containing protein [Candidatus Angelobacter sp.]|nr:DNRLRE domain-containing protein [Candidatus Angelobacter sp.]
MATSFAFAVAANPVSLANSVTLTPVADTTLFETTPTNNLGAEATLICGTTASGFRNRAVLKFDIAEQIPPGAVVTSATLTLTVVKVNPFTPVSATFELHRLLQPWGEGTGTGFNRGLGATNGEATWDARAFPNDLWSSPGAAVDTDYAATVSSSALIDGPGGYPLPSTSALIADVQSWLDDTNSNLGWILVCTDEATPFTSHRLSSRESASGAPSLLIEYTPAQSPLQISALNSAAGKMSFQFNARAQQTYAVEFTDALSPPNWQTLTNIPAQSTTTNIAISIDTAGDRLFCRIRTP